MHPSYHFCVFSSKGQSRLENENFEISRNSAYSYPIVIYTLKVTVKWERKWVGTHEYFINSAVPISGHS